MLFGEVGIRSSTQSVQNPDCCISLPLLVCFGTFFFSFQANCIESGSLELLKVAVLGGCVGIVGEPGCSECGWNLRLLGASGSSVFVGERRIK